LKELQDVLKDVVSVDSVSSFSQLNLDVSDSPSNKHNTSISNNTSNNTNIEVTSSSIIEPNKYQKVNTSKSYKSDNEIKIKNFKKSTTSSGYEAGSSSFSSRSLS
jgi:hypothetical protein